jgi:enterobacteria phage integrase
MPRRLPPYVERNHVKGHTYLSYRRGKGPRIRLPNDPTTSAFMEAYQAALHPSAGRRLVRLLQVAFPR